MTQTEEQTLAEQEALLAECKLYKGEKEPDTKDAPVESDEAEVVTGLPVTGPATTIIGAPVHRAPWSTGIFACFGNGDEHFSSDLEVCVLGAFAPCVLYASNMERLYPGERVFTDHCLHYSCLYFLGSALFNANNLAPCFSAGSRIALRRKYNLEGDGDSCGRLLTCCGGTNEDNRERCDSICDIFHHNLFHTCALCQEGRELRRRTLHPAYQPYMPMTPPMEQHMTPQM
jgi:Cys-rich protein (TIGR01571 family)